MKSKILLIDDETEILNVYERILVPENGIDADSLDFLDDASFLSDESLSVDQEYEVIKASNGAEGVEMARLHPDIKVAFVDMRMPPGINGAETARQIREINPKIEFVIATAYSDINLQDIVKLIGTPEKVLYLRKPFATEEIEQLTLNLVSKYNNERIKERFLSNISHEMKTPLSITNGFASMLVDELEDEEHKDYASSILSSGQQLEELVNSLLLLTEINDAKANGVDISKLSSVFEEFKKSVCILKSRYPDIDFDLCVDSEDVNIAGKPHLISHALTNIVDNSFKFTKKGSVNVTVRNKSDAVVINIKDSGIGIPKDKVKYVFDKFYRVEDIVHTEVGFGIGLSNSKEIIDRLCGKIDIISEEDVGTNVQITLPLVSNAR